MIVLKRKIVPIKRLMGAIREKKAKKLRESIVWTKKTWIKDGESQPKKKRKKRKVAIKGKGKRAERNRLTNQR